MVLKTIETLERKHLLSVCAVCRLDVISQNLEIHKFFTIAEVGFSSLVFYPIL